MLFFRPRTLDHEVPEDSMKAAAFVGEALLTAAQRLGFGAVILVTVILQRSSGVREQEGHENEVVALQTKICFASFCFGKP